MVVAFRLCLFCLYNWDYVRKANGGIAATFPLLRITVVLGVSKHIILEKFFSLRANPDWQC